MTNQYEPKGPFSVVHDIVHDASLDPVADTYGYTAFAARCLRNLAETGKVDWKKAMETANDQAS